MSGSGTSIFCLGEPDAAHADTWQSKLTEEGGDDPSAAFPWPIKVKDQVHCMCCTFRILCILQNFVQQSVLTSCTSRSVFVITYKCQL